MFRRIISVVPVALAGLLSAWSASAQAPPSAVNDCTFLREPLALRDCLDRAENQRSQPGTEQSVGPGKTPDSLLKEAGPIAGRTASGAQAARPAPGRSGSPHRRAQRGDGVRIEQVPGPRGRKVDPP